MVCGRGQCARDSYGKVYCAPAGGGALPDQYGTVKCGTGYCTRDEWGEVFCSRTRGGAPMVDTWGKPKCLGGCEGQGPSVARRRVNRPSPRNSAFLGRYRRESCIRSATRCSSRRGPNASRPRRRYGGSTDPTRRQRPPRGWKILTLDRGARNSRLLRRAGGAIGNRSFRCSPFLPKGARSSTRRTRSRACIARCAKRSRDRGGIRTNEATVRSIRVALRNRVSQAIRIVRDEHRSWRQSCMACSISRSASASQSFAR